MHLITDLYSFVLYHAACHLETCRRIWRCSNQAETADLHRRLPLTGISHDIAKVQSNKPHWTPFNKPSRLTCIKNPSSQWSSQENYPDMESTVTCFRCQRTRTSPENSTPCGRHRVLHPRSHHVWHRCDSGFCFMHQDQVQVFLSSLKILKHQTNQQTSTLHSDKTRSIQKPGGWSRSRCPPQPVWTRVHGGPTGVILRLLFLVSWCGPLLMPSDLFKICQHMHWFWISRQTRLMILG